jgi:predicted lactoylglutathione lyase
LSIVSKLNKVILFGNFFLKEISDTPKNTEAIVALSAQSREEVDQMMEAGNLEIHRIMDGCMAVVLRTLMDIFGEYFTWMKVP